MTEYDRILEKGNPETLAKLLEGQPCPPNYGADECVAAKQKYNQSVIEKEEK